MITIETTMVNGSRETISGISRQVDCGSALVAFMRDLREDTVMAVLSLADLRTREVLGEHLYHFVSYRGTEETVRAFREALWYYTRHPHCRAIIASIDARRLEVFCEQYRWDYREEAKFFPRSEDANVQWRYALLFAARIKNRDEIARAIRVSDENFDDLIRIWVNDHVHEIGFSDLLSMAEDTSPTP